MIVFRVKTLGIVLICLNVVTDSNDGIGCPAGSVRRSVFEQSCTGTKWEVVPDPRLAFEWCKKRLTVKCVPIRGSNKVEVAQPSQASNCRVQYVKQCNRHDGPTRCRVRPRKNCGRPFGPTEKGPRIRNKFGTGRRGSSLFDDGSESNNINNDFTVSGMSDENTERCRVGARYVKKCRADRDPKCIVVPFPETDCTEVTDEPSEDFDDNEASTDGFDEKDIELMTDLEKKKTRSGVCVLVNTRKCHNQDCEIVPEKVCPHGEESDGKDQEPSSRSFFVSNSEKPDDYLEDNLIPEEDEKGSGSNSPKHTEDPLRDVELNDVRDLEYIKNSVELKKEAVKKAECKLVKSCKSVPKRVCEKSQESGGNVFCKESLLEDCEVSFENNNLEICHVVMDKICKPLPFIRPQSQEYDSHLICREVDVHICSTEYEVEMVSGTRISCVRVPRVKCDRIPDHYGYRKHSKSCNQVNERICRQVSVVEPQPKRNDICHTHKVKTCHYKGGTPVMTPELVVCSESERNLCGMRQTKELVPDVCFTDSYPFCHFSDNSTVTCRNVMQEECQMIEKC